MKKPHKFRAVTNGTGTYDWAIYCEYCGMVVFHANRSGEYPKRYEQSKQGCPCAPEEKLDADN